MNVSWTSEQISAITSPRDVLLSASAGTGKTTTIVGRIMWALGLEVGRDRETGEPVRPCEAPCRLDQVAAITFTEKGAHDLQDKLRRELETAAGGMALRRDLERATVGTIHGFAADLLREHALRLDIDPTFRILDQREVEVQQTEVIRAVLATALRERDRGAVELTKRYGLTGWKMAPGAIGRIRDVMRDLRWRAREFDNWSYGVEDSRYTRTLDLDGLRERARFLGAWAADPDEAAKDELALGLSDALYRLGRASVHHWLNWLERENARDFDSLILDARRLLTRPETASALRAVRRRYRLFIIDEFQDTDRAQWDIAQSIMGAVEDGPAPEDRPSVILVGDPKQSIYRFRGADIDVWNDARTRFEGAGEVLELSWNFRCEPRLVDYVNRVGEGALGETARALEPVAPDSAIGYQALRGARDESVAAGLEWIAVDEARAAEQRAEEATRVAGRLYELIGKTQVVDSDDGSLRTCRAADIAVLARRQGDLRDVEAGLRSYGIPFYNATTSGLADQQEVLDMVTALRLVENPFDDLRAFAFLRSPFVGLRDEVLCRITLLDRFDGSGRTPLLERAERFLASVDASAPGEGPWFPSPEGTTIDDVERRALDVGLTAIRAAQGLADRADHAEILVDLLDRTGYRLHLLLREGAAETLANVERFLALLEEYRHLTLASLLALWDRWGDDDLAIPQARLFSAGDDVVTLSTIHGAKGLEWPVVALVGAGSALTDVRHQTGRHWGDPSLGPIFLPRKAEQGPRAAAGLERLLLQEEAEEARLLYVAATRARDRLIVVGPPDPKKKSFATWLGVELPDAREAHEVAPVHDEPPEPRRTPRAEAEDKATGTGGQIDAFGGEAKRQLDLFNAPRDDPEEPREKDRRMVIRRHGAPLQTSLQPPRVSLAWLADIGETGWPDRVGPIPLVAARRIGSATERMLLRNDPETWSLRYEHGVVPPHDFLADASGDGLSARARGNVIHGILERIHEEEELGRVLEETIASLDLGDLELALAAGSRYRAALEEEIAGVIRSAEWRWYVEGEHYRELRFLHRTPDGWLQGAFDLLRPAAGGDDRPDQVGLFDAPANGEQDSHADPWIIDFKTHRIDASMASEVAKEYEVQAGVYREAAAELLHRVDDPAAEGETAIVRVGLHFTHPNVAIEVEETF